MNQTVTAPLALEGPAKTPAIQLPDGTIQHSSFLSPNQQSAAFRNGHVNLDTFSPVNENGSFEFDRVLKSKKVCRRVKLKHVFRAFWKPAYLVLRPNLLSVYKDEEATRLRASITLSEVTAVAPIKSPRSTRQYVFGIFTPSKNYRFQASSDKDMEDWIERIRAETRIDEDEEAFLALSKRQGAPSPNRQRIYDTTDHSDIETRGRASSPEFGRDLASNRRSRRLASPHDYSANDVTSYSEWSDGPGSNTSIHLKSRHSIQNLSSSAPASQQSNGRNHDAGVLRDPERVMCNGYLQCLKIKGGVRHWKRLWVVLRPKSLAFYKDDQEYSAIRIIPMSQVLDATEVDPVSRSKKFCLQVIAEEKIYRLCTPDEESLAKWLGSLKSILVARKKFEHAPGSGTIPRE
ncbi:PH domain protein [Aspergillus rambellii]|uniref:PH domain protein n=1 Tax=Aspergillus rambellii TaxID=308745 RepID=A0A0F8X1N3_9EURO|nr:PH domain protein [Aspergillus rambellii]